MYNTAMMYGYVCVAGTFDGLHRGHEALLLRAFEVGLRVLIGLTSEAYLRQYKNNIPASSYGARRNALEQWIGAHGYTDRATIVPIDDPFEPAASDPMIDALIVSEQSRARGEALNHMRTARGFRKVSLVVAPMVQAQNNTPISTTRVREGKIDRSGRLVMPNSLRNELAMPLGVVLSPEMVHASLRLHANDVIISVGDQTTKTLLDSGITPNLMIIDNKVNRQAFDDLKPLITRRKFGTKTVASGPGFISREAIDEIRRVLSAKKQVLKPYVLEIDGEEDLLALPAIIEAPIGSVVYYGQPARQGSEPQAMAGGPRVAAWVRFDSARRACGPERSGVVEVIITKERKKAAKALLLQFIR